MLRFVKAVQQEGSHVEIWRSYQTLTPDDQLSKYTTLWQAVSATLATSSLSYPANINTNKETLVYGSGRSLENSCLHETFTEAETHFLDGGQILADHLDCFVSVGCTEGISAAETASAGICSASQAAYLEFIQSHASKTSPGQFCRLEMPPEPTVNDSLLLEDHTQLALAADRYFTLVDTSHRLRPCFSRLLHHRRKCRRTLDCYRLG